MLAPSYISAIVVVLVQVLAYFGVQVGSAELTTTITTLITVFGGLFIAYRQVSTGKATILGARK